MGRGEGSFQLFKPSAALSALVLHKISDASDDDLFVRTHFNDANCLPLAGHSGANDSDCSFTRIQTEINCVYMHMASLIRIRKSGFRLANPCKTARRARMMANIYGSCQAHEWVCAAKQHFHARRI